MSDLKQEIHLMTPVPMRTAEEQWQSAGYQCSVYATLDEEGLVFVNGKGGSCVMRQEEWTVYEQSCLEDAPMVSMRLATAHEDEDPLDGGGGSAEGGVPPKLICPHCQSGLLWGEDRGPHCDGCDDFDPENDLPAQTPALLREDLARIYDSLRTELGQIRDLVGTAKGTMSVEDYGDALTGAFDRLSVCIGCVEGLLGKAEEMGRRGDAEMADDEIELSGLKAECARLRGELRGEVEGRWDDVRELNERLSKQARDYLETMSALRAENVKMRMILEMKAAAKRFGEFSTNLKACEAVLAGLYQELKGGAA